MVWTNCSPAAGLPVAAGSPARSGRLIESSVGSRQSRDRAVEDGNEPGEDCSREEKYRQAEGNRGCERKEVPFLRAPSQARKGIQPRGDEDDGHGPRETDSSGARA